MTCDWDKLNQIFHQALERAGEERAAFIRRACAEDLELREEALALLAAHEEDEDFMETPLAHGNLAGQFGDWQGKIVGALQAEEQRAGHARPPDYLLGRLLDGKYRIEQRRGQGGMGAVYRATHEGTGRRVAIKVIAPELMANPEFVERFKREAKAAGMLNHPHVVNVTDFGLATQAGAPPVAFLVMEYLEGLTLADLLKEQRSLRLELVVSIIEQVCRAIDEAHGAGILHRDLKPENIWLEPAKHGGYNVKVLDFGLAKLRDVTPAQSSDDASHAPASISPNQTRLLTNEEAATLRRVFSATPHAPDLNDKDERTRVEMKAEMKDEERACVSIEDLRAEQAETRPTLGHLDTRTAPHWFSRTGMVLGTPLYMSPEQCRGEQLDTASDIYSLGVIAYQMLAGEAPFAGTTAELLSKHKEREPPSLFEKRPELPFGVASVLAAALSKERAGRPATAGAFACALRLGAEGERAIRAEANALYRKHRWLFLKTAARVHLPVIVVGLLLLASAALAPIMSGPLSLILFSLLWLVISFLILYGNAATTAACALIVEQLVEDNSAGTKSHAAVGSVTKETGRDEADRRDVEAVARAVWRKSGTLAGAVLSGLFEELRALLSLRPRGWRAYFDSLLLIPVVAVEKRRGPSALDRAQRLGAHVRQLALDIRALHVAALIFSLLAYQAALLVCGVLLDRWPSPAIVNQLIFWLPLLLIIIAAIIRAHARTGLEHALLYMKAREINGEHVGTLNDTAAAADVAARSTTRLERARFPHGRAVALMSALTLSMFGWQLFKQEVMISAMGDGGVSLVKAAHASGLRIPLWSEDRVRPLIGFLINRPPMVQLMLDRGADVNARIVLDRGWASPYHNDIVTTPLMAALSVDAINSSRLLLENGADLRAQDSNGRTPLMVAAINSPAAIDLLLSYGADINERTGKGMTALLCAARYRGLYEGTLINEDDLNAQTNVAARLLDKGADVKAQDEEGRTALMMISMEYRPDRIILPCAEALLKAGADINARDRTGRTPLMYAVRHRQRATVNFLLQHGADPLAKDDTGATALDLANQLGFTDIVRMLTN